MSPRPFDSVIIGFDGSPQSADALALGSLLGSLGGSRMVLAYVGLQQPPFVRQTREYAQERRRHVHNVLEPAISALSGGREVEPASVDASSAGRGLFDLAFEYCKYGSGVVTIGSAHRGPVGRVLLGSVGEALIAGCPCPIAVAPRGFAESTPEGFSRVVIGFDGSAESHAALQFGRQLAALARIPLHAVAVASRSGLLHGHGAGSSHDDDDLAHRLDEALAQLGDGHTGTVVEGDPVHQLADAVAGEDLLVLGARGYGPHRHVFAGSVSSKLVRSAPSSVMVVPRPGAEPELSGQP